MVFLIVRRNVLGAEDIVPIVLCEQEGEPSNRVEGEDCGERVLCSNHGPAIGEVYGQGADNGPGQADADVTPAHP